MAPWICWPCARWKDLDISWAMITEFLKSLWHLLLGSKFCSTCLREWEEKNPFSALSHRQQYCFLPQICEFIFSCSVLLTSKKNWRMKPMKLVFRCTRFRKVEFSPGKTAFYRHRSLRFIHCLNKILQPITCMFLEDCHPNANKL